MGTAEIIPPDITPEENQKRIKELERVLSNIFDSEVTVRWKTSEDVSLERKAEKIL
jgi:hypothetical protein